MNIWIIIPTYNEAENLSDLIQQIDFELKKYNYQILIIDDNSPDKTGKIAKELSNKFPIQVLERERKLGLGSAYIAGFKIALQNNADLTFEMDADGSHNPKDLEKMILSAQENDLVIGSRKIKGGKIIGWNWWRHFCSNGAMIFSRLVLNLKTKDVTSGFRCYQKKVLEKILISPTQGRSQPLAEDKIKSNGYAFQEEMLYKVEKLGFKIKEIPVTFIDRKKGKSKLNYKDVLEFFKQTLELKFKKC